MLERSRSLRIPGAVYRRFALPEPTMGIALAWRQGDEIPTLRRLLELAERIAGDGARGQSSTSMRTTRPSRSS